MTPAYPTCRTTALYCTRYPSCPCGEAADAAVAEEKAAAERAMYVPSETRWWG